MTALRLLFLDAAWDFWGHRPQKQTCMQTRNRLSKEWTSTGGPGGRAAMRSEPWVWPKVGDAGTSAAGAVPLRSAQKMGQQKKKKEWRPTTPQEMKLCIFIQCVSVRVWHARTSTGQPVLVNQPTAVSRCCRWCHIPEPICKDQPIFPIN